MRTRIYYLLKEIPGKSRPRTSEVIGCTGRELKKHLEDQFTPEMCWENYGTYWHVDHIIPLASAGEDVERLVMLCHYTNLQPLSAKENLRKGSKLIVP